VQELKEKCHPLGVFPNMERLGVAANMTELYDLVLRDTPLGPYFSASISSEDLDEMNLEILRNTLHKAYLDDFAKFCEECAGCTAEIMSKMMQFEVRSSQIFACLRRGHSGRLAWRTAKGFLDDLLSCARNVWAALPEP
jgi:vacuolar-type H+-ATPase subunit C/Vma6